MADQHTLKLRRDNRPNMTLEAKLVALLGVASALMLGISLASLTPDSGPLASFKILLVTVSAGTVAYAVNRFALDKGAHLAAVGYIWAGLASVAAILLVGAGLFIGAFCGLTYAQVEARVQGEGVDELSTYVTYVSEISLGASGAVAPLGVIAQELQSYASCERRSSCLSGKGSGGYGPVAKTLEQYASRASTILDAFDQGEGRRKTLSTQLTKKVAKLQETLADETLTLPIKRARLQALHLEVSALGRSLETAIPLPLVTQFKEELESGVVIPGDRDTSRKLSSLLAEQALMISKALEQLPEKRTIDAFPNMPGMVGALSYLADFAAYAAVIFVAELVLPLTLWVLKFLRLSWELERQLPAEPPVSPAEVPVDSPSFPPFVTQRVAAARDSGGQSH